jgi:spore maturation protein CgeB
MRLLLLGSDYGYSIERYYLKYLREFGIDVTLFGVENLYAQYAQKNLLTKIINKVGINQHFFAEVNRQTIEFVKQHQPTHILVFKGMQLYPQTIQTLKNLGCFVANYNPDHPFIFSGSGSGNQYVTDAVPYYDLHFCYSKLLMQTIEKNYGLPTVFLPFGYELSNEVYEKAQQQQEIVAPCFIGNPDKERIAFINSLLKEGVNLTIYGHNWERYFRSNSQLTLAPACYQQDYWLTLQRYRVQINVLRKHNVDSHNMRTFEIGAIGGVQLANDTTEHREFFEENKEIFLFTDIKDCVAKINGLLKTPEKEIKIIRQKAHQKSIKYDYSYRNRTKTLIEALQKY